MSNARHRLLTDDTGKMIAEAIGNLPGNTGNAATLDTTFGAMLDGSNTTHIFASWWPLSAANGDDKYTRLGRFFTMLSKAWAGKVYTLRGPDYRVSGDTALTPMADLADKLAAACYTEVTPLEDEWVDDDPMTWYVRANALSLADGTMNVLAVEGVDDGFDVTGNTAPVYTFSNALWTINYTDGQYEYKSWATQQMGGMWPYACDVDPENNHRPMTWHPTFGGSLTADGKLTSGVGNTMAIRKSASQGLTAARLWDAYEGTQSDTDVSWLLDMWQLRHYNLENSGILEGCTGYNKQYVVAMAEEGVKHVTVTAAQGATLIVGSNVCVGSHPEGTNTDRNTAANYDLVGCAEILSITSVTIDDVEYAQVELDISEAIDVPATGYVSTMPWATGSTERVPGHKDGSLISCTAGNTPARIAGIEVLDGAYALGLDPLWQSTWDANGNPKSTYHVYECRDSQRQASTYTNYTDTGIEFYSNASGWQYIKHHKITKTGLLIPEAIGGSTTTYLKSAFYFTAYSGVRAPWRFASLAIAGPAGLAAAAGGNTPSDALWYGRPRLSGSGKKRGEWQAAA